MFQKFVSTIKPSRREYVQIYEQRYKKKYKNIIIWSVDKIIQNTPNQYVNDIYLKRFSPK